MHKYLLIIWVLDFSSYKNIYYLKIDKSLKFIWVKFIAVIYLGTTFLMLISFLKLL